jgi:glycine/serine hydroxymethyltransferase
MKEQDVRKVAEYIARCLAVLAGQKVHETEGAYDALREEVSAFNKSFPMP